MDPQYAYQSAPANFMPMMAGGGLAAAAQQLQGQGRGGDSMLVHMTPGEVKGLQALAQSQGTSLSINPNTGLPEAFKLKQLLPTLIGAGLSFIPGVGPLMAASIVGGVETARTGDLGRGLLAGLGAFGGANIAGSLFSSAAGAAGSAGSSAAAPVAEAVATPVAAPAAATVTPIPPTAPIPAAPPIAPPPATSAFNVIQPPPSALGMGAPIEMASASPSLGGTMTDAIGGIGDASLRMGPSIGSGPSSVVGKAGDLLSSQQPPSLMDKVTGGLGKAGGKYMEMFEKSPLSTGLMTVGGISALMPAKKAKGPDVEGYYKDFEKRFGYDPRTRQYPVPGMAPGGEVNPADEMTQDGGYAKGGLPIAEGSFIMPARETAEFGNGSSTAGLAALSKLGARPIQGPGDGVSDSIRANIGGKQEARVARDEAHFPPEAVARIGGGSHKKGTKKLYAMMKAAQDARKKADRGQDTGLRGLLA